MKTKLLFLVFSFFFLTPSIAAAAPDPSAVSRSYDYPRFDVDYVINPDSTVDVVETQTFHFVGTYNQGLRTIPTRIGEWISDVSVFDVTDNHPLAYSTSRLNKTSSASWGNYTTYQSDGYNIEWYYNLSNTTHTFQLRYRFHGAIEFGTMYNRFYWNAFDDFRVPIHQSTVTVKLPSSFDTNQVQLYAYRSGTDEITQSYASSVATFSSSEFTPYEAFTVDLAWPRGYLDRGAYWRSFLLANFGYLSIPVIFLLAIIACLIFWLTHEYFPSKARPIIPIYEPPSNLPPAIAGVLVNESFSSKSFAATIVDLAVRGYLKITELHTSGFDKFFYGSKHFQVTKTAKYNSSAKLKTYETKFLDSLFDGRDTFSTLEMAKAGSSDKRSRYLKIVEIQKQIIKLAQTDTNAYIIPPSRETGKWAMWIFTIITLTAVPFVLPNFVPSDFVQTALFIAASILGVFIVLIFIKFESRLNQSGNELKEKWLGFKLFLSVAEKERLKNLTPDLFEKYLPYAMVFGVEKKWSRAFDSILTQPPSWYSRYVGAHSFSTGGSSSFSGSFSASSFGASFSSSFSSSFASSGAAGASGGAGGGGAGGGGGGGGGGAS